MKKVKIVITLEKSFSSDEVYASDMDGIEESIQAFADDQKDGTTECNVELTYDDGTIKNFVGINNG